MNNMNHLLTALRTKSRQSSLAAEALSPTSAGPDYTKQLPDKILQQIFSSVCPHTSDFTYEPCEQSQLGDGCMLCDLRDLAYCAQTCRRWYPIAQKMQFTNLRIDAVHYCALEEILLEKRPTKASGGHFRHHKHAGDTRDIPSIRLDLLSRTLRENRQLASQTRILKTPYMTRETAKGDLARAVGVLPNLEYADLPDGFFSADASSLPLRTELQTNCPNIKKMSYRPGSEEALESIISSRHWQAMEYLDLKSLTIEPATLRHVLDSLPALRELTLSDMPWLDDSFFASVPGQLPEFPALESLKLIDTPNVGVDGLLQALSNSATQTSLTSLTLQNTGVKVHELYKVLTATPVLRDLSFSGSVAKSLSFTAPQIPVLSSRYLKTLHYEITNTGELHSLQKPADSYHSYLVSSIHQYALPALANVYVRDHSFPELVSLPSLPSSFTPAAGFGLNHLINPTTLHQKLEVYTKGIDEHEWIYTAVMPPAADERRGSLAGGHPLSAYTAARGLGSQWATYGGERRKSSVVGNGFGGFLAVPTEEVPRRGSAEGKKGLLEAVGAVGGDGAHVGARRGSRQEVAFGDWAAMRRGSRHELFGDWGMPRRGSRQEPMDVASALRRGSRQESIDAAAFQRRESRHDLWR